MGLGAHIWALACALCLLPLRLIAEPDILSARYAEPTTRYAHGVLGDAVEWGALVLDVEHDGQRRPITLRLPDTRVFEDLAPRLIDTDQGRLVMVVESDRSQGARLALYDDKGPVAATPFIGRANRWLAPVGAVQNDDGSVTLAYVDRPHLAKVLRFWRFQGGALTPLADLEGLTNHQIGWDYILGGLRDCGDGPEWITADAGWRQVMSSTPEGSLPLGPYTGPDSITAALACA